MMEEVAGEVQKNYPDSALIEKLSPVLEKPAFEAARVEGTAVAYRDFVAGFARGDRVACGGAGYATHSEYNFIPKNLCVKIPDGVGFEDASFATVGAIAMQGVRQADLRLGECAVVIGLGLLGLLTVQLLKASGCAVLGSDPDPDRCQLARDLGAEGAVSGGLTEATAAFTDGHGADAVIITDTTV